MSNRRVVVLSGVSGSGKTFLADELLRNALAQHVPIACDVEMPAAIVSVDDYFLIDGVYRFDPKAVRPAHQACFSRFIDACQSKTRLVVVDNVNTTTEEIAPYVLGGESYGYDIEIVTLTARTQLRCGIFDILEYCVSRNIHGVQSQVVFAQHKRIVGRVLPVHWKHSFVPIVLPDDVVAITRSVLPKEQECLTRAQWIPLSMKKSRNE